MVHYDTEFLKILAGDPKQLLTIKELAQLLIEARLQIAEAIALLRESRQYAGVEWMVKTDNFLNDLSKLAVSSPICMVQTNCHGGKCGNLLPCDIHPGQHVS